MAERKSRMRSALGIKDDFVEGSCLDQWGCHFFVIWRK
jgi:hypothetical protein